VSKKIVLIQGEYLGRGDETLGKMLMSNYLRLLGESEQKPEQIVFWNNGVKMVCEHSPMLDHLKKLEANGVELLACTTCLEYFDLKDKQVIGKPTTMLKSIAAMMNNDVVSL
jgi:selenium metabolism protein YedF